MSDRSDQPCGERPNCVSTQDSRADFQLAPFELVRTNTSIDEIETVALTLPGAKTAEKKPHYLRVECTSRVFRFVDDLELRIQDGQLLVRSESRVGYSDFGVNRKRSDALRQKLLAEKLIQP